MNTDQQSRLPFAIVLSIAGLAVLFGLGYVAIQAGPWTMVALVLALLATGGIALFFFRGFTDTGLKIMDKRLDKIAEDHRHEIAKLTLELKYNRLQIEPPVGQMVTSEEVKKLSPLAIELLGVTVDKMGELSTQLLPFNKAQSESLAPFDNVKVWQAAMKYWVQNGYAKEEMDGNRSLGVFLKNGRTAIDLFNQVSKH